MILRGIQIENWRCIRGLELADLPEGVVILHGPNRTGKSSLVLALRACLFDYDHNTSGKDFKANLPRSGDGPPRVAVEFSTGGSVYRLTKVFSRRSEGKAVLEKQVEGRWQVEEDAPKEASRKVRELLGAERSAAGLNQLLWIAQGDVRLPEPGKLDASLEKQLVGVLGVLVTGRDLAFRNELTRRLVPWFTAGGDWKKASTVRQWEQKLVERMQARHSELDKFRRLEEAIKQLEGCEDVLPGLRQSAQQAAAELSQIEAEREQSRERIARFKEARQALATAELIVTQAEEDLRKFQEARLRGRDREEEVARAADGVASAGQETDRQGQRHVAAAERLQGVRSAEDAHLQARADLDGRRQLAALDQQLLQMDDSLAALCQVEEEIAALEEQQAPAPDEGALQQQRDHCRRAAGLRARIDAAALTLQVDARQPLRFRLLLDGQEGKPVDVPAGESMSWSLRQKAAIDLGDLGTLELARGHEDLDLKRAARELEELECGFAEFVGSFREDPKDERCLDRLAERRIEQAERVKRLQAARQELARKAPAGRGGLEGERARIDERRQLLLARRPDLAGFSGDVEDLARQFEAESADWVARRKQAEAEESQARQARDQAESALQKKKEELAARKAAAQACQEELQRLGNELALQTACDEARRARTSAEQDLAASQLSPAEVTIEERWSQAKTAQLNRQERLREREDQLLQLRGQLLGNEGLHIRLADAESAVREAESALAREKLEADAHRRLADLFDECRDQQVERVMGPVAGRVLDSARKIGLDDFQEVRFGDAFLPEGVVVDGNAAVGVHEDSYGTAEQLSLLVRLALGGVLAREEPHVVILDDPLAHSDPVKHRRILEILQRVAAGDASVAPAAGRLQILILTCHPERFDYLPGACHINLEQHIERTRADLLPPVAALTSQEPTGNGE